ncbi:RDD family protein [Streptomyces jumonjinensis]|uniref:RDD family protein n=1 Tax=Streptomyces jumonjinensis TaxID=1945 RepID=A0A646KBB1_STRJU|nr:RDD family protein [Streptomyces jumonjinensis]MQS99409.1 RDD family protein [Streptomyces jumonjinensis]
MSNDQPPPPGPGGPEDDPFLKKPQEPTPPGSPYGGQGGQGGQGGGQEGPGWQGGQQGPGGQGGQGGPYGGGQGGPYGSSGGGVPPYDPSGYGGPYGGGPDPMAGMPPLADYGRRLGARVIDILIVFIPLFLLSLIFGGWGVGGGGDSWDEIANDVNTGRQWAWSLISMVAYVGYDTWMVKKNGQTVGKRLLKLRVAMLNDGSVPDTRSSLLRAAVLWVPAVLCCFCVWWLVIVITIVADKPYRQGLHDKAGRTVVVTVPEPA